MHFFQQHFSIRQFLSGLSLLGVATVVACSVDAVEGPGGDPDSQAEADAGGAAIGEPDEQRGADATASDPDAGKPDASSSARQCNANAPFGAPELLGEEGSGAWLSADERTLLFYRLEPGANFDLFQATRSSGSAEFGAAQPFAGINGTNAEYSPSLADDGLSLYYVRSGYQAYKAQRESLADEFGIGNPLSLGGSDVVGIGTPRRLAGGVYYLGWGEDEAVALYRDAAPTWEQELVYPASDHPQTYALTPDEKTLYVTASTESGNVVRRSTRTDTSAAFATGETVAELGTFALSWISADECVAYGAVDDTLARVVRPE